MTGQDSIQCPICRSEVFFAAVMNVSVVVDGEEESFVGVRCANCTYFMYFLPTTNDERHWLESHLTTVSGFGSW